MALDVVAKARSFLIRSLAVVILVLSAAWGGLTSSVLSIPGVTSLLSVAGISSFLLTTSSTSAEAYYRRRRRWRGRGWYGGYYGYPAYGYYGYPGYGFYGYPGYGYGYRRYRRGW